MTVRGATPRERRPKGYFLFGRWVSAEAAAVFAAALDLGLLKTFPAADAAFKPVTFEFRFFVKMLTSFLRLDDFRDSLHKKLRFRRI